MLSSNLLHTFQALLLPSNKQAVVNWLIGKLTALTLVVTACLWANKSEAQILQKDSVEAYKRYTDTHYFTNTYNFDPVKKIDTSLVNSQRYNPVEQGKFNQQHLGVLGSPHNPVLFEYHNKIGFNFGIRQFDRYFFSRDSIAFFRGPYPYARISYSLGGTEEQLLRLDFSQPISQQFRYTMRYKTHSSPGIYDNQKAGYNNFVFNTQFGSKNNRYQLLNYFLLNTARINQNGGLELEGYFTDTIVNIPSVLATYLDDAKTRFKQNKLGVQNSYDLGKNQSYAINDSVSKTAFKPLVRIGHKFEYSNNNYTYNDSDPNPLFYPNFFVNQNTTADTTKWKQVENEFFIAWLGSSSSSNRVLVPDSIKPKTKFTDKWTVRASFLHQWTSLNQDLSQDTIPVINLSVDSTSFEASQDTLFILQDRIKKYQSGLLKFHLSNQPESRIQYSIDGNYALFGFNLADFDIDAEANLFFAPKIGGIKGRIQTKRISPDFQTNYYFSNHYRWNNNFKKTNSLHLYASYYNHKLGIEFTYANHTLDNFIRFNESSQPEQLTTEVVNISQFILRSKLKFWKFHLQNTLVYQVSQAQNKLNFPSFWGRNNFFYRSRIFKNAMVLQTGLDIAYNTDYFANNYSPALGQFYVQNDNKLSFYPVMDLYLSMKIKTVNLFFKMQHINQGIFKQKGYFTTPQYPMPDRAFRFGVSWMFYD